MDCHFRDLPDFQNSEARLMTASAVHKLSEYCAQWSVYCLTRITIPGVSIKKVDTLNSLPTKNCETFWGNFHNNVWLKVSSIMTPKYLKILYARVSILATFVKGMKIRLHKSRLSVLAEWKAPQRRNCRWCDEFYPCSQHTRWTIVQRQRCCIFKMTSYKPLTIEKQYLFSPSTCRQLSTR